MSFGISCFLNVGRSFGWSVDKMVFPLIILNTIHHRIFIFHMLVDHDVGHVNQGVF